MKKQISNILESENRKSMLISKNDQNCNMKLKTDIFLFNAIILNEIFRFKDEKTIKKKVKSRYRKNDDNSNCET